MAKTKTIEDLFVYIDIYSNLLPFFLYILFYKQIASKHITVIIAYCLINFLINFLLDGRFLNSFLSQFLYSLFTFFEFILFSLFFYLIIKSKKIKWTIIFANVAFVIFLTIYDLTVQFKGLDSIPIGIETILILLFSFYYLYEQMNNTETLFIYSKYEFWIAIGCMLYLAGSFFIYIFANQSQDALTYWYFTNIFSIIKNIMFSIGVLVCSKSHKNPSQKNLFPHLN